MVKAKDKVVTDKPSKKPAAATGTPRVVEILNIPADVFRIKDLGGTITEKLLTRARQVGHRPIDIGQRCHHEGPAIVICDFCFQSFGGAGAGCSCNTICCDTFCCQGDCLADTPGCPGQFEY
jgi:hypothetical protein